MKKKNNNGFKELINYMNTMEDCYKKQNKYYKKIKTYNSIIEDMNDPRDEIYIDTHYSEGF